MESGDETRKKRDCPDGDGSSGRGDGTNSKETKKNKIHESTRKNYAGEKNLNVKSVDIETALHHLFEQEGSEECLLDHTVIFRCGHAGDAPAICTFFGKSCTDENSKIDSADKERKNNDHDSSSSALELWLSEALGDESRPPSIFSIVAEVSSCSTSAEKETSRSTKQLGALALFTLVWKNKQRILQTESFHVDNALPEARVLKSRIWLHLSALALMAGACLSVTGKQSIE